MSLKAKTLFDTTAGYYYDFPCTCECIDESYRHIVVAYSTVLNKTNINYVIIYMTLHII